MDEVKERFRQDYDSTYDYLHKYLLMRCGPQETEDILQNVYLAYYRRLLQGHDPVRDPKHYLLRAAKHELAELYGSTRPQVSLDEADAREIVDERALRELEQEDLFQAQQIMELIKSSDPVTYRIFQLHFVHGLTLKKVADLTHLTESGVKSKLYRQLKKLKKQIGEGEQNESL